MLASHWQNELQIRWIKILKKNLSKVTKALVVILPQVPFCGFILKISKSSASAQDRKIFTIKCQLNT